MRSYLVLVADRNRLPRIECGGGVAARHTAPDTVHLVSTAATPLGGDLLDIRVIVEPGAQLRVRSAAAAVALPGAGDRTSQARCDIDVAGVLDFDLEPMVVAADARHLSDVRLRLHHDGQVRLRERVQIGRSGEYSGFWSGSLRVDRNGLPMLRHRVELGPGSVADDALGTVRAAVSELRCPPAVDSGPAQAAATVLELADGGTLSVWQGERLAG